MTQVVGAVTGLAQFVLSGVSPVCRLRPDCPRIKRMHAFGSTWVSSNFVILIIF
jgi:hypothetical protein